MEGKGGFIRKECGWRVKRTFQNLKIGKVRVMRSIVFPNKLEKRVKKENYWKNMGEKRGWEPRELKIW